MIHLVRISIFSLLAFSINNLRAQEQLYSNEFPLENVRLLDGIFKNAQDLNIQTLLKYDVDRLIAPYLKQAGLETKGDSYKNWDGLDGHIAGHYLTAMALNYASSGNLECKNRLDYIISELEKCQNSHTNKHSDWGTGYVGGVPNSAEIWKSLKNNDLSALRKAWVPWYNLHKMYAGLRDAWLYGKNSTAKSMFLKFCDWGIQITAGLSDEEMENMLNIEYGGMNEIYADAYQITGQKKYIETAKRFSHKMLLNPMSNGVDNLDNKHANTQVPKAIGFERIGELTGDSTYLKAGEFFWQTVTENRSLAFGGNSRREHFPSVASSIDFVNEIEGPESCNTYNMLKLSEDLFRVDPDAKYVDFYERALYNHILSTQHPEHGGYVYFTPTRPRHYRVYSAPNEAMWCCVGSGMENHGKYSQFIYTHSKDSLYLNLFIPSSLHWKDEKLKLEQHTNFPYDEKTKLIITEGNSEFTLMIRCPSWVEKQDLKISVNGQEFKAPVQSSNYVPLRRKWKKGDTVEIHLPMHHTIEHMPNIPEYVSILYGPIVLGSKTGTQNLKGLIADDGRWAHIATGERLPIDQAPIIIEENVANIGDKLIQIENKPLHFDTSKLDIINADGLILEPFFQIHDSRYMMYWMALSQEKYNTYIDSLASLEKEKLALIKRTVDAVGTGEQQPEADHFMESENSVTGNFEDEFWRSANNEGYFSYKLNTKSKSDLTLIVRYWGAEWGNRKFDIYIDDRKLMHEDNTAKWNVSLFQDVSYKIPQDFLKNKEYIRVKFQASKNAETSSVYNIRIVENENE